MKDLEAKGAIAVYAPLEGGFEGRYLRRLRAAGYKAVTITARGLGDPATYLTGVHGVRPAHLGKKTIGNEAAVGPVYYVPPVLSCHLGELSPKAKGVVLWILEGQILSSQELNYLVNLPKQHPKLKVVVEMGGAREFTWTSLPQAIAA